MKYERDDRDDGRNEERVPEKTDAIDLGEHVDEIAERRVMGHEGSSSLLRADLANSSGTRLRGISASTKRNGWPTASPTSPISRAMAASCRLRTASGSSSSATVCGTPTVRSDPFRRNILCYRGERSLHAAVTQNLQTCARPTTRWMKRRRRRSRT